jgi:hypothetical protein
MIRDFLDHLLWELRTVHYEVTGTQAPKIHPELGDQLRKYMQKYNCAGLLAANRFGQAGEDVSPELKAAAVSAYRKQRAELTQKLIDALESLQPLFAEAFQCATSTRPMVRDWKYSDFIEPKEE